MKLFKNTYIRFLEYNTFSVCAFKPNFAYSVCAFKPKFAHSVCAFKPKLAHSVCAFKPKLAPSQTKRETKITFSVVMVGLSRQLTVAMADK